jgi:hypothetical protein
MCVHVNIIRGRQLIKCPNMLLKQSRGNYSHTSSLNWNQRSIKLKLITGFIDINLIGRYAFMEKVEQHFTLYATLSHLALYFVYHHYKEETTQAVKNHSHINRKRSHFGIGYR